VELDFNDEDEMGAECKVQNAKCKNQNERRQSGDTRVPSDRALF
jgi:hypothetical protein